MNQSSNNSYVPGPVTPALKLSVAGYPRPGAGSPGEPSQPGTSLSSRTKAIGQFTGDLAAASLKAFWLPWFSVGQWVESNLLTTGLLLPLQKQPCDSAATTPGLPWDQHVIHSPKPLQQGLWQLSLSCMLSQGYLFHMVVNNLQHNLLPAYIADSIQSFHLHIY